MRFLLFGAVAVAFTVGMTVIGLQFTTHEGEQVSRAAGPRLEIGDSFDLGDVPSTGVVERSVVFRNTGVEPLRVSIVKVRPAPDGTCGCGVEAFSVRPDTLQPGESGELVFMLRVPEGMPGMEDRMVAELETNDPARPTVKLTLVFRMES